MIYGYQRHSHEFDMNIGMHVKFASAQSLRLTVFDLIYIYRCASPNRCAPPILSTRNIQEIHDILPFTFKSLDYYVSC